MAQVESFRCLKLVADQFWGAMYITGTPGNFRYNGPLVSIMNIIVHHLGLCYEFVRASDHSYGLLYPNGSWSGLLGMVQRKEADFTGTLITVTWKHLQTLDCSEPLLISEYNVVNARPAVTPNMAGFIMPYTPSMWLLMSLCSVIVFVATLFILRGHAILNKTAYRKGSYLREEKKDEKEEEEEEEEEEKKEEEVNSWSRSAERSSLWTWSALMGQNMSWGPRDNAARVVVGLWLMETLILGTVYRSNLKAMLILPKVRLPFDNLEELVESGITLGIPQYSTLHGLVRDADSTTSLGRLKRHLLVFRPDDTARYLKDAWQGKLAGSAYAISLKAAIHIDFSMVGRCRGYMMSRGFSGPASLSLAFYKGSPLLAKVNRRIVHLREAGILDHLFKAAHFNASECLKHIPSTLVTPRERSLELLDFYGVFSLYLAGIGLALAVFLLEATFVPTKGGRTLKGDGMPPKGLSEVQ